jgi:hypothetical protein
VDPWAGLERQLERQAFLAPAGQAWAPNANTITTEPLLGSLEARERVVAELGRALTAEEGTWWKERTAGGVTEADLQALLEIFCSEGGWAANGGELLADGRSS